MTEVWEKIKDYPNYEVSNLGNVKSINYNRTKKERLMSPDILRNGYMRVCFSIKGIKKTLLVHRLVACTFNDLPLDTKSVVCHKNDIRIDNSLKNLFIGTQKDNIQDALKKGRFTIGTKHKCSKLNNIQVIEMRRLYDSGNFSQRKLAEIFGVNRSRVHVIVSRKGWKHI